MRSDLPDWTDLQYFIELARRGSLSATARALGVTHATVSRRIAALETRLAQPLFERRSGRYVLTGQGEQITALAEGMEERAHAIARAAAGSVHDVTGSVRITTTEAFGAYFLIPHLKELGRRYPGIRVELVADQRNLSLARRDADIALRMARPQAGDLVARKLCENGHYFYGSESYLRERRGREPGYIGYDEANEHLPEPRHFARVVKPDRIVFRTSSLNTRVAAVRAGIGLALLPRYLADVTAGLVRADPAEQPLRRELWLLVHHDLKDVPRVRVALDFLGEVIAIERERLG